MNVLNGKNIDCDSIFSGLLTSSGLCFTFNTLNSDEMYRPNVQPISKKGSRSDPTKCRPIPVTTI